jgi:GT2 family glycosyltransferase
MTVAAVVIGRNEGARLGRCLASVRPQVGRLIYVDSGSGDDSVVVARGLGAEVVELDSATPFTAARARNAGFAALEASGEMPEYVQFVDGDCIVDEGWIALAVDELVQQPDVAIVTGWRREENPGASVYNAMLEVEWHRPAGEIRSCGGDMMVRSEAFARVGGFDARVIASEDEEFCLRVRKGGQRVLRLAQQMTSHDAAMVRFSQWWRRSVRSGHGFAQVGLRHRDHFAAERRRVWVFGLVLPMAALVGAAVSPWLLVPVLAAYGVSYRRTVKGLMREGLGRGAAAHQGLFLVLSKFPNLIGLVTYYIRHIRGAPMRIIEYKAVKDKA